MPSPNNTQEDDTNNNDPEMIINDAWELSALLKLSSSCWESACDADWMSLIRLRVKVQSHVEQMEINQRNQIFSC